MFCNQSWHMCCCTWAGLTEQTTSCSCTAGSFKLCLPHGPYCCLSQLAHNQLLHVSYGKLCAADVVCGHSRTFLQNWTKCFQWRDVNDQAEQFAYWSVDLTFSWVIGMHAAAVVGGVGNVWKLNQVFPTSTSSTASEDEKKKGVWSVVWICKCQSQIAPARLHASNQLSDF